MERRTVGFYNYPMSQVADILLPRAHLVPVGEDQAPHIEMTREVARKFNRMFGRVFPEPASLIGDVGRLVGLDGNAKMSSSKGNAIMLSDGADEVERKVRSMYTDPKRIRADIPGTVEGNPVFEYHAAFNPDTDQVDEFKQRYRAGKVWRRGGQARAGEGRLKRFPRADSRAQVPVRVWTGSYVEDVLREGKRRGSRGCGGDDAARARRDAHQQLRRFLAVTPAACLELSTFIALLT